MSGMLLLQLQGYAYGFDRARSGEDLSDSEDPSVRRGAIEGMAHKTEGTVPVFTKPELHCLFPHRPGSVVEGLGHVRTFLWQKKADGSLWVIIYEQVDNPDTAIEREIWSPADGLQWAFKSVRKLELDTTPVHLATPYVGQIVVDAPGGCTWRVIEIKDGGLVVLQDVDDPAHQRTAAL